MKHFVLFLIAFVISFFLSAQNTSFDIRLNQVGYLPNSVKYAAVTAVSETDSFRVLTSDLKSVVYRGQCLPVAFYSSSNEYVRIADFTLLQAPGSYVIELDGIGKSLPFSIDKDIYLNLSKASIKAFYFNRASMPITSEFGGIYARKAGHPDTSVIVLPSAASNGRPAGTKISTPGGWYDAGDYNKYIVNSGITVFTLLSAYETYPEYFDTLSLNIPESNNNIPDILDEALWNIKWMMTMQDPFDGGVYHKTTEAQFSAFSMPDQVKSPRYVTAKSTGATLDFAAVMAMTARIYKKYLPDLADSALDQSLFAYKWAADHPRVTFSNPSASGGYPAVGTGGYGDSNFSDEFSWCAAELYITTKDPQYYKAIGLNSSSGLPGWGDVRTLGLLSLIVNKDSLTAEADTALITKRIVDMASGTQNNTLKTPYRIPGDFFYWGGNSAYANWGMIFMQAFRQTGNAAFFNAALSSVDYLLGRNATSYCFVTGFGTKNPKNVHHRLSGSDGIREPIPGFLVGGPGPGSDNDCGAAAYPSTYPAKFYLDQLCSYSTNEIAINWNAPLSFLSGAVNYEYQRHFLDTMPRFFSVSTSKIPLSNKKTGEDYKVIVQGNTNWELHPTEEWIKLSTTRGEGSGSFLVNSNVDNTDENERSGLIYIYSLGVLTDSITVIQNGMKRDFQIECEDYKEMSGLQTEVTTDEGSGQNIGYADINDWVTYNIDVNISGVFDVVFRHAGYAANFDVYIDDEFLKKISVPATADWQVWASHTVQMELIEGPHEFKIIFNSDGINLNWIQFKWIKPLSTSYMFDRDIRLFPIPADKNVNIEFGSDKGSGNIQIVSLEGKTLYNQKSNGFETESIDVSSITSGIYILKGQFNKGTFVKRFLIK